MADNNRFLLKCSIASTGLAILLSAAYAFLGVLGKVPSSWLIFILLLVLVGVLNAISAYWVRRNWINLSFNNQAVFILWFVVSFWYWTVAPFYYFLTMQLDKAQFVWVPFAFLWEVPIIGGVVFVCAAYFLLRPIQRYFEGVSTPKEGEAMYIKTLRYPVLLGLLIFSIAIAGYFIGAIQVAIFADFPPIEQIKNVLNGMAITLFLAGILYFVFDSFLEPVRAKLEHDYQIGGNMRSWPGKVFGTTVMFALGTMALIALMALNFFQNVIVNSITYELEEEVAIVPAMLEEATLSTRDNILRVFQKGHNGELYLLKEKQDIPETLISKQSKEVFFSEERGVVHDYKSEAKLIAFFDDPKTGDIIVSVVYIKDFYSAFRGIAGLSSLGAVMLLFITFGFAGFISYALSSSIRRITKTIRRNRRSGIPERIHVHSGDELEELSNEIEKVIELDEAKSDFVSLASHHLRTPLVGIQWSASRILRKMNPKKDVKEHVKDIEESAERLASLVSTLLSVSRIESDSVGINPEKIDITKLIRSIIRDKKKMLAKDKNIKVTFESVEDSIIAQTDKTATTIVFDAVLSNAIEYTPNNGRVDVVLHKKKSDLVLAVSDTGIGIPKEERYKIFGKMMRARNAKLYKPGGLGLGLYMTKRIVELLGGKIWFESEDGKGSTFYIRMPLYIDTQQKGKPLPLR